MKKTKVLIFILFIMTFFMTGITVEAKSELPFPMHVIQKNAPDNESNVIVFFGDGFTEDEQDKFIEVARKKAKVLMEIEPLKMHKESFNIYAMQVVSKESGSSVDVGKNPPTPYKDTYFNIRFNYAGMYRLTNFFDGGGKRAQVLYNEIENNYLDAGGKIFHATVIINSNEYGGSGGAISITSLDSGTNTMILHEAAHSFAGLRDEYWTGTGEGVNKTQNNNLATIKWKEFVGFRGVGAFAYGKDPNQALWFKPVAGGCLMETLYTNSFCPVCSHEVFNKINLPRIKVFKKLYIAKPIFTTETTNKEVVSGLTLKDNNIDLKTVIHNYTNEDKIVTLQIIIKDGNTVVKTIEEEKTIPANTLKSVQSKVPAMTTANENYKLEINIYDKENRELVSTNTDALKKAEVPYYSYLGNGTHNTTIQLPDVDKFSVGFLIGKKVNPVAPEIKGYTYRSSNISAEGILVEKVNNPAIFYYTKNEGKLHVIYKDTNGFISGTQDKKIGYGETFIPQESDVPKIDNYDTVLPSVVTYDGIEDITITYQYKKQTKEVWVGAVDKLTGKIIAKVSIGKKQLGETITIKAPTASEIYELARYELADIEEKQINLSNINNEETVLFYYSEKKIEDTNTIKPGVIPPTQVEPDDSSSESEAPSKEDNIIINPEFNIKLIAKNATITEEYQLIVRKHAQNVIINNQKLDEIFAKYVAYYLELKKDGENVKLTDKVIIKFPIPEGYTKENIKIYYINDKGNKVEVISQLEKDYISFETNHLTTFIISEEKIDMEQDKTQDVSKKNEILSPILITSGILCILIISVLITNKKKNKK